MVSMRVKIDAWLMDGAKTLPELMELMPGHARATFCGRLSELKAQNKARKNGETWVWVRAGHLKKEKNAK